MRTKTKTKEAKKPEINEIDVDALIEELKSDLEAERQVENARNWLRYCFNAMRQEAEKICDNLKLPQADKDAILAGKHKSHDKFWDKIGEVGADRSNDIKKSPRIVQPKRRRGKI